MTPAAHRGIGPGRAKGVPAYYDRLLVPAVEPDMDIPLRYSIVAALAQVAGSVGGGIVAVRRNPDTRSVHQLRVAILKLRNGLRLLPRAWPAAQSSSLDRDLHWLRTQLAVSREWDLLLGDHALWQDADAVSAPRLHALAQAEQKRAADHVAAVVRTLRCEHLEERLGKMALPPLNSLQEAGEGMAPRRAIEKQFAAVVARKHACGGRPEDYHRLRKAVKRLGYSCQLLEGGFGDLATRYAEELGPLQHELGKVNDATVALGRLQELERRSGLPHGTTRRMRAHLKRRRDRHIEELQPAWKRFRHARRFWRDDD